MMIELAERICPAGELALKTLLSSRGIQVRYLKKGEKSFFDLSRDLKTSEMKALSQLDAVESFVE